MSKMTPCVCIECGGTFPLFDYATSGYRCPACLEKAIAAAPVAPRPAEFIYLQSSVGLDKLSIRKSTICAVEPKDTFTKPGANVYVGPTDGYFFEVKESPQAIMKMLGEAV